MAPKLVAFGNVLLDFTYCIEKNPGILGKYGFEPNTLGECSSEKLLNVEKDARETCEFLSSQTGGSALNTSKILSLLGETGVLFCGAIGNDANGSTIKQQLEKLHLKSCLQEFNNHPTGTCVCLINAENRCCYANIGASIHFEAEFLRGLDLIESNVTDSSNQIFYVEGFFITGHRFSVCKYIVDELCGPPSAGQRLFATNLSAEYIIENHSEQMKYLAENATILFGNRDEFDKLAEIYRMNSAKDIIAHLFSTKPENGEKIIICTQGARSVLYSSSAEMCQNEEFHIEAVPKEKILDTTGCGDSFVAGFFYAFLRHEPIERCIAKGAEVARKKITSIGANFQNSTNHSN